MSKSKKQDQSSDQAAAYVAGLAGHPKTKSGKLSPNGLACLCGCGAVTVRTVAKFQSGHDAKLKGRMVRIVEDRVLETDQPIPEEAIPFLMVEGIAGYTISERGVLSGPAGSRQYL